MPRSLSAVATHLQGDARRAVTLLEESQSQFREVGDRRNAAVAALNLADALRDSVALDRAIVQYRDALVEFADVDDREGVAQVFLGLGGVMARVGQFEGAAKLLGAASVLKSEELGAREKFREVTNLKAAISAIRSAFGEEAFTAAWEAGRALPLEAAVQVALSSVPPES